MLVEGVKAPLLPTPDPFAEVVEVQTTSVTDVQAPYDPTDI